MKDGKTVKEKAVTDKERKKRTLGYGLGAMGLALLVTAAFFAPKLVLELQDNVRCSRVVLGELESMDVTSFNTGYETDLYIRLTRFAEGLEAGRQYMVAEQELTDTLEVEDRLLSNMGLYQDSFLIWIDNDFFSYEVLNYGLQYCKQYVIYGDDFAEGVNFILWYLELRGVEGTPALKLLLDAETGEIYGLRVNQTEDTLFPAEERVLGFGGAYTLAELLGNTDGDFGELWCALGYYYGEQEEMLELLEGGYGREIQVLGTDAESYGVDGYTEVPLDESGSAWTEEMWNAVLGKIKWEVSEDGNRADFFFPYGQDGITGETSELCFRLESDSVMVLSAQKDIVFRPKNFVAGFPEIYERIPEFME